jgi:hypothetical protein
MQFDYVLEGLYDGVEVGIAYIEVIKARIEVGDYLEDTGD